MKNILGDKVVLKAEFEEDSSGSKRRSSLWPSEKEDKKKKRRYVVVFCLKCDFVCAPLPAQVTILP